MIKILREVNVASKKGVEVKEKQVVAVSPPDNQRSWDHANQCPCGRDGDPCMGPPPTSPIPPRLIVQHVATACSGYGLLAITIVPQMSFQT